MKRFAAFEDSALQARLTRLRRAELDLQKRAQARIVQAEAEGRWVPSDPMYQRLSSVLRQVRADLHETEQEHLRRAGASPAEERLAA
jgi:uncharacterized membrane protein YccC